MTSAVENQDQNVSNQKRTIAKFGSVMHSLLGVAGVTALIKGATYINEKEEICPWSPDLITFLLIHGTANVVVQLFYINWLIFAFYKKSKGDLSKFRYLIYVPVFTGVINGGIIIWGLVLLYSNPKYVTFDDSSPVLNTLNGGYCDISIYLVSMIVSWWYVTLLIVTGIFFAIMFIRSKN